MPLFKEADQVKLGQTILDPDYQANKPEALAQPNCMRQHRGARSASTLSQGWLRKTELLY